MQSHSTICVVFGQVYVYVRDCNRPNMGQTAKELTKKKVEAKKTVLKKKLAMTRWRVLRDKTGMQKTNEELAKYESMFLDLTQILEVTNVSQLVDAFIEKYVRALPFHLACIVFVVPNAKSRAFRLIVMVWS